MRNCSNNRKTNTGARIKPEFQALPSNKRVFYLRSRDILREHKSINIQKTQKKQRSRSAGNIVNVTV